MQNVDVIVLGAGIAGVSTALHLQQRGLRVALVDRRGAGEETSYGNAGIIEASFVLPFGFPATRRFADILLDRDASARADLLFLPRITKWLLQFYGQSQPENREVNGGFMRPLVEHAVAQHQELMQGTQAMRYFSPQGRVKIYRSKKSFDGDGFERGVLEKLKVPYEVMDPQTFSQQEPHLKPIYYRALKLLSSARVTDPGGVTAAYASRFVNDGGAFIKADAASLKQLTNGNWQVGDVAAPQVAVTLGPWAPQLLKPLGYDFPIGLKRGYHQHFQTAGNAQIHHAIVDTDIGYVMGSTTRGLRITTGAEFAAQDAPPNPVQIQRVLPFVCQLVDIEGPAEEKAWLGCRPCTPDSLPIIGRAMNHKGLWLNIGHGHSGFTIGPATGKLVAQMITGQIPFTNPAPYRPERF